MLSPEETEKIFAQQPDHGPTQVKSWADLKVGNEYIQHFVVRGKEGQDTFTLHSIDPERMDIAYTRGPNSAGWMSLANICLVPRMTVVEGKPSYEWEKEGWLEDPSLAGSQNR